jgi:hypothetical protein
MTRSRRVGLRVLDAPVRSIVIGVAALVLALSGLFGGLDKVTPDRGGLPTAVVNTPQPGGPWTVTVIRSSIFDDLPPLRLEHEGDLWLQVLATVEVTDRESRNDMREIFTLDVPGLLDKEPKWMYLGRDATLVDYLHPGMPERIGFFWELSGSAPVPTELHIIINGRTERIDSLTGSLEWLDFGPRSELRVPVKDERGT